MFRVLSLFSGLAVTVMGHNISICINIFIDNTISVIFKHIEMRCMIIKEIMFQLFWHILDRCQSMIFFGSYVLNKWQIKRNVQSDALYGLNPPK